MDNAKKLIIGFSTSPSIVSSLIRTVEGANYSHVYVRFYSEAYDRWLCYHAQASSLHFLSYESFREHFKVIEEFELEVSEETMKKLVQYCIDNAGKPYGRLQLVGMAISRISYLWFSLKLQNPFADGEKTQVCSELVYHVAKEFLGNYPKGNPECEGPRWINSWVRKFGKRVT